MRQEALVEFAKLQAARVRTGDIHSFVDRFEMPLPMYTPAGMGVVSCSAAFAQIIEDYVAQMHSHGICSVQPGVVTVIETSRMRALAQVTWNHVDGEGRCVAQSVARYVVRQCPSDAEPKIEMIEYLKMSFPQVVPDLKAAVLN